MRRLAVLVAMLPLWLSACLAYPDRQWEAFRDRNHLQRIDDTDPETWILHAVVTVAAGHVLALIVPGVDRCLGMRIVYGVYAGREILNRMSWRPLRFDYRYKPLDGVMDVAAPVAATELLCWAYRP